jgi:hypothetical protein
MNELTQEMKVAATGPMGAGPALFATLITGASSGISLSQLS